MQLIDDKIREDFSQAFDSIIREKGGLDKIKAVQPVLDWYDEHTPIFDKFAKDQLESIPDIVNILNLGRESTKGRDAFLSKLSNIIVRKIMTRVTVPFVNIMINKITITTNGKTKNVTFNADFTRTVVKPYIEFILKINGEKINDTKIRFMVDITATMNDIKFEYSKNSSMIYFGILVVALTISTNFKIPVSGITESIRLGSKSFNVDLSKFSFALNSSDHNLNSKM
ncbi:MAG: hypothetical protein KGH95_00675 [Thaumarchaeota archaeon]|nr:hypothetical protein [Nitrososphaerota archaeon]